MFIGITNNIISTSVLLLLFKSIVLWWPMCSFQPVDIMFSLTLFKKYSTHCLTTTKVLLFPTLIMFVYRRLEPAFENSVGKCLFIYYILIIFINYYCILYPYIKGKVQRDFWPPGLFINQIKSVSQFAGFCKLRSPLGQVLYSRE